MFEFILFWFLVLSGAVTVHVLGNVVTLLVVWPWLRKYIRRIEVKQ